MYVFSTVNLHLGASVLVAVCGIPELAELQLCLRPPWLKLRVLCQSILAKPAQSGPDK